MSGINSVGLNGAATLTGSSAAPTKTREAAQQFEALLIASMLQSARQDSSWLGSGEEAGGASAIGYAEEHLARTLAAEGGLGIANLIMAGLDPAQNRPYAAAGENEAGTATKADTASTSTGSL